MLVTIALYGKKCIDFTKKLYTYKNSQSSCLQS